MKLDDLKARLLAFLDRPEIVSLVAVKDGDMVNITTRTLDPFTKITDLEALVGELGEALAAWRRDEVQAIGAAISTRNWHSLERAYNSLRDKMDRRATLAKLEKARGKDQDHG